MDVAIRTIARLYKWNPTVISELYLDDLDSKGLYYWFKDAKEYIKQINSLNG